MFSHVVVGANDLAASKFYHAVLSAIGLRRARSSKGRIFYQLFSAHRIANYFIFAGYLVFVWGIVGTANYFDAVRPSRSIR
jgi:hypothetical protein